MKPEIYRYTFDLSDWKSKLLYWADRHYPFLAMTSGNGYPYPHGGFGEQIFLGEKELTEEEIWKPGSYKVGIIGYDFKNQLEELDSTNPAFFALPELCFFQPTWKLSIEPDGFTSPNPVPESWIKEIIDQKIPESNLTYCAVSPQISREEYLSHIRTIQDEILEGSTYEANFCQAFSGEFDQWDPIASYFRLNQLSPMPFSSLFKADSAWLVSASPERFLKKSKNQLLAQPIKGTIRRGISEKQDLENKHKLLSSEKERAENLMITDLMRNDLARVSKTGSVHVEELFGIYPLPRVFQMISSINSEVRPGVDFKEIIQATFPMGSMTGAPKINTMKIIDREESFKRQWFSGAFGWVDEQVDFDFSVIIRSIIADLKVKKLYFGVGSAITIDAKPEHEYDECALKAQAILELLRGNNSQSLPTHP